MASRSRAQLSKTKAGPASTDRRTPALLACILVGVPLAILPARFETYDTTPKLAVLCLGLALLLWLPSGWWRGAVNLWSTRVGRAFYLLLILGVVSVAISSVFSRDGWLSFTGTTWRRLGAVDQTIVFAAGAILAAYLYLDQRATKALLLAMEAAAGVTSIYAVLQYAGWDPLIPASIYTLGSAPGVVRPPATLTQATYFATFLLAGIFVALGLRISEKSASWKRAHEVVLIVSLLALLLSGTRSALLGLMSGVLALVYFQRGRIANGRAILRTAFWVLIAAIAISAFVWSPMGRNVRTRLRQWTTDREGGPRLMVWRASLPLFLRHAAMGVGPELFEAEFRKVEPVELARAFPDHYHESPHNFFLEAAVGEGLPALGFWIGLLSLAIYCGIRCSRARDPEAVTITAALIAMLLSLQFCPLTITNELYLVALCAMLVARNSGTAVFKTTRAELDGVIVGCSRAVAAALLFVAITYTLQAALYSEVEQSASAGDFTRADDLFESASKFPIPGPNLDVSRQLAASAGRLPSPAHEEALRLAGEAAEAAEHSEAERFNALYQSALLAINERDLSRAEVKLNAAIDASPTWYRPRMALASVLWWEGRTEEAQSQGAAALSYAGSLEPNVKRTLDGARAQAYLMRLQKR